MGQILHGCAKTTYSIREELQRSKDKVSVLSKRYNINPKTVIKWRKRADEGVMDKSNTPKKTRTVLSTSDEAIIIAFRKSTQLPLDDCYDGLISEIPHLTRSNLYRCLLRHGLSCLPKETPSKEKKKFKSYDIGFVHVDITEVRVAEGSKFYIYVAICRISKFVYTEIHNTQTADIACSFLNNLVLACPFKIHTILTDNGVQFAYTALNLSQKIKSRHKFTLGCNTHGIRHKRTKPYTPKTNGQVERFNRTLKEATVKSYYYENKEILSKHLDAFVTAYNYAKRLSSINRLTPAEMILA
jgi:transposase-like protein